MEKDTSEKSSSYICWDVAVAVGDLANAVKRLEELGIGPFVVPDALPGAWSDLL